MPHALALTANNLLVDPRSAAAIDTWRADLAAEGWTTSLAASPLTVDGAALAVSAGLCDHVQIFGRVPVPQVSIGADGHGVRLGDCDAPYATDSLAAWTGVEAWPSPPLRTVSRHDLSGVAADEPGAFAAVMARNHAYRTGAYEYTGVAVVVDRFPEWQFPGMAAGAVADLGRIVGADNVCDLTSRYPDNAFFQTYAGRSFLVGALYSGGLPFAPPWMDYVGKVPDFAAGLCPIGVLSVFGSYMWEFARYPIMPAALLGGSLAVLWNLKGQIGLADWQGTATLGDVVRGYQRGQMLQTIQGDGTLRRRDQEMGVSQAQLDALTNRVAAVEASVATLKLLPSPAPVFGPPITSGGSGGVSVAVTSAWWGTADGTRGVDVTSALSARDHVLLTSAIIGIPDPAQGQVKVLRVSYIRNGVAGSVELAQNTTFERSALGA